MKRGTYLFLSLLLFTILISCNRNPLKVDISGINTEPEFVRFEKELFSLPQKDTLQGFWELREKNPGFFDLFTYKIIQVGGIDDEHFVEFMNAFLTDTMILNVKSLVEEEFSDFDEIQSQITKAFKYYQYHFPNKNVPAIYTYISGFNQSVVTAENIIGISLDKYLGRDCGYYRKLSTTPQYKTVNMHKEKIVSDIAYAWGITEFDPTNKATNLLGNMIHQGKLMYFVDALLPEMNDTLKIGYSEEQLKWCKNNEAQMWLKLVETKMLYSNKRMDIIRYINDGPYTNGFPLESPARTGVWIGWQIVRKYMKEHPEVTLPQLMQTTDYQKILNESGYFPE
jgi:gliding motility-associated lipoprotein GldB